MAKIVTAAEMAALDRRAIEDCGIPSLELMERAGAGIAVVLGRRFLNLSHRRIHVVCGRGNNGGDGLVVARCLRRQAGACPVVWVVAAPAELSADARENLARLPEDVECHTAADAREFAAVAAGLSPWDLIVDALLGTGASGPPRPPYTQWIEAINQSPAARVAVDLPSGMDGDRAQPGRLCVRADLTVTLGLPKRGLVCHGNLDAVGGLEIVPLGFPPELTREDDAHPVLFGEEHARRLLPRRPPTTAKWDAGRLLVLAGSETMQGAGAMVANAAVLAGAGLVQLVSHGRGSLHPALRPEVLTGGEWRGTRYDAVVIGPGLGGEAALLLRALAEESAGPVVVDADALVPFVQDLNRWRGRPAVLTPHVGELARMIGVPRIEDADDRMELAAKWAREWRVTLLVKGPRTLVADSEGRLSVNASGNAWMASGGMGDALAGILGALLAQGMTPWSAARLAAYLSGAAADRCIVGGARPLAASEVAAAVPEVWQDLAAARTRPPLTATGAQAARDFDQVNSTGGRD